MAALLDVQTSSYKALERAVLKLIEGADRRAVLGGLSAIDSDVEDAISSGGLEAVVGWAARLDRLRHNLPRQGASAALVFGYLTAELDRLDRAAARLAQERDVATRGEMASGVREQVLAFVQRRPRCRSGEIAESLELDRTQVSRALRELQDRDLVWRVESDAADHDKRVRRYAAAPAGSNAA